MEWAGLAGSNDENREEHGLDGSCDNGWGRSSGLEGRKIGDPRVAVAACESAYYSS